MQKSVNCLDRYKMFAQVKDVIESALNSKGGVALLVPHVDYHFINYLGRTLLKSLTELNYFFIESYVLAINKK